VHSPSTFAPLAHGSPLAVVALHFFGAPKEKEEEQEEEEEEEEAFPKLNDPLGAFGEGCPKSG